ncbi:mechanosensitive ion channel domain-containing protein [Draconibacterium halophilum]|uniref:Mechanosensitive ion channel n=1 Tax=Draconibacterium halophilum TaxID=2706887 RepID=A0A6C0R9K5_9BACT|nr:mechanosensitive ion channel domain-containing protein [Draconibacterium halophilum]QIA06839.1 mechanosensitive ion channel [Draconibacterium halophilum]
MEEYKFQIAETIIIMFVFLITKLITKRIITKVGVRFKYQSGRIKITNKIVGVLLLIILTIILMIIWGVDQSELLLFLSTILTILGVAFFAQWSIISNITSTLIIFFNHPIKIGDSLTIMDKDYQIEGKLNDIGIFFIIIKTKEDKKITIPSNVFMQKMIQKEQAV